MSDIIKNFVSDCFENATGKSFKKALNPFGFYTIEELKINQALAEQLERGEIKAITKQGKKLQGKLCDRQEI